MFVSTIIPAAGMGRRMGTSIKKQYLSVNAKEILEWTISAALGFEENDEIIIVVPEDECIVVSEKVKLWFNTNKIKVVAGGATRDASVLCGLKACNSDSEVVFIHDGVRPFIKPSWFEKMLKCFTQETLEGLALGKPVSDTLKEVGNDGNICRHIDRSKIWAIETPQLFKTKVIRNAHLQKEKLSEAITDDTQLISSMGKAVKLIDIGEINLKITTPVELEIAKAILK